MKPQRWKPGDCDTLLWIIFIACVVSVVFYVVVAFGRDRYEENAAPECQQEIYELFIEGQLVELPDMDAAQCSSMAEIFDQQTKSFARIECRKRFVCRQQTLARPAWWADAGRGTNHARAYACRCGVDCLQNRSCR